MKCYSREGPAGALNYDRKTVLTVEANVMKALLACIYKTVNTLLFLTLSHKCYQITYYRDNLLLLKTEKTISLSNISKIIISKFQTKQFCLFY